MAYEVTDFEKEVIERSHEIPVVVDFWADWCGPCLMFAPIIEKAADEANGEWGLVKVNTEEQQELAARFGIRSLPTIKLFHKGEVVSEKMGAMQAPELNKWIKDSVPSESATDVGQIGEMMEAGKLEEAEKGLNEILVQDPGNEFAQFLQCQMALAKNPATVATFADRISGSSDYFSPASYVKELARLITRKLPEKGDSSAGDAFLNGKSALSSLNYGSAAKGFLASVEADREWNDGAAKEALKQIFFLLGPRHEVTSEYQPKFASLLYS